MFASVASAGVCRIGTKQYDTLQAAFDAAQYRTTRIVLLQDLDLTSRVTIKRIGDGYTCTLDGNGHTINRKFAGQTFYGSDCFIYMHFTNVVVNGCGADYAVTTDTSTGYGAFFLCKNDTSSVTLESGCVISNFVTYGALINYEAGSSGWNVFVKDGARIVYNTIKGTNVPKCALLFNLVSGGIYISGGEIAYNTTSGVGIAADNQATATYLMSGGDIHHNTAGPLFYPYNYSGKKVTITGGQFHDNRSAVVSFGSNYGTIVMTGGMVYGNSTAGVSIRCGDNAPRSFHLSGDAVIAANGGSEANQSAGVMTEYAYRDTNRITLDGDFSGYVMVGDTSSSQGGRFDIGSSGVVENTNNYTGAECFHCGANQNRILKEQSGVLKWANPNRAKIGSTAYVTLAAALAAAADGAVIDLQEDELVTATLVPPADKTVTVNGNGKRIFRCGAFPLFTLSEAGSALVVSNVTVQGGRRTSYGAHTEGDIAGAIAAATGAGARIAFGENVAFKDVDGSHSLVSIASGTTLAFDGTAVTNIPNKVVVAEAGSALELKGATEIRGNDQDLDVPDGNVLRLTGNLAGPVHVTVDGVEPCKGQVFGQTTGAWTGLENFIKPTDAPRTLHVEAVGGFLTWCKNGFAWWIR